MPQSKFVLQDAAKSRCPGCLQPVVCLVQKDARGPIFFICFACQRVFQAGWSEVRREQT